MTKILQFLNAHANRVAVILTAIAALATALAPVVADTDWTSIAGSAVGLIALVKVVDTWLKGWQAHEADEAYARHLGIQAGAEAAEKPKAV